MRNIVNDNEFDLHFYATSVLLKVLVTSVYVVGTLVCLVLCFLKQKYAHSFISC